MITGHSLHHNYSSIWCYDLDKLKEFTRTYEPHNAIKWYTNQLFSLSLLQENIDVIFKLRYFIHDLHNQLAQMQVTSFQIITTESNYVKTLSRYKNASLWISCQQIHFYRQVRIILKLSNLLRVDRHRTIN